MRAQLILFAMLGATSTPVLACQCDDPATLSAQEREERARWIVGRGFIIAEVVRLSPDPNQFEERYQVVRGIVGVAPKEIVVQRHATRLPDGSWVAAPVSSCDYAGTPGLKQIMAFSFGPTLSVGTCGAPARVGGSTMTPAPMCTQYGVQDPSTLDLILRLKRDDGKPGEPRLSPFRSGLAFPN